MKKILMATLVLSVVRCGDIESKKSGKKEVLSEPICPISCTNHTDCAADELCEEGICTGFSCQNSADCEAIEFCDRGSCLISCDKSSDCEANEVCSEGGCRHAGGCNLEN